VVLSSVTEAEAVPVMVALSGTGVTLRVIVAAAVLKSVPSLTWNWKLA
jgi:hypothetical protein